MAGIAASVGPMAAVAGAVAQFVGEALLGLSDEVIVENGGDVYVCTQTPRTMCVMAESAEAGYVHIRPHMDGYTSYGVCTSSGRLGPSLSLGNADSVTVLAERTAVAEVPLIIEDLPAGLTATVEPQKVSVKIGKKAKKSFAVRATIPDNQIVDGITVTDISLETTKVEVT